MRTIHFKRDSKRPLIPVDRNLTDDEMGSTERSSLPGEGHTGDPVQSVCGVFTTINEYEYILKGRE